MLALRPSDRTGVEREYFHGRVATSRRQYPLASRHDIVMGTMSVARYLRILTQSFFKWWWAVATGVASILSWLGVPSSGITISPIAFSLLVFVFLALVFLLLSTIVQGHEWYVATEVHPEIVRIVPPSGGMPPTFVVRCDGRPLAVGVLLSVYRDVAGQEVCMALLRLEHLRQDGGGWQCRPLWMSPGHQRDLSAGRIEARLLRLRREIPEDALQFTMEGSRS